MLRICAHCSDSRDRTPNFVSHKHAKLSGHLNLMLFSLNFHFDFIYLLKDVFIIICIYILCKYIPLSFYADLERERKREYKMAERGREGYKMIEERKEGMEKKIQYNY